MNNGLTLEEKFKIKFQDIFKNKIYTTSNQKINILPHGIGFDEVNSIFNDVPIDINGKYVVFFNFEFVFMLISKKIPVKNITYIANHKDSLNFVKDSGFLDKGLKSILFDLSIYKKYADNKKWIEYLMQKIGKRDDFIVVGNIPFTTNGDTNYEKRGRSKQIGDDFIELIDKLSKKGKAVYILRANFETKAFKDKVLTNSSLKKITFHTKPIFDINDRIYTATVVLDFKNDTTDFIYNSNDSDKSIKLIKDTNLILSKNILNSYLPNMNGLNLGSIWKNGTRLTGDITNTGKFKMITSCGSYKDTTFPWQYDETENTTIGEWKVVMPYRGGGRAVKIAGPEYSIGGSVIALVVENENKAKQLQKWIIESGVTDKLNELRVSLTNSKGLFTKIDIPNGII